MVEQAADSKETKAGKKASRSEKPAAQKVSKTGTLLRAAQAISEVSPTAGTVQDVLEGRVLGHYAEGLKQYLSIRLGNTERGAEAFAKLRDQVAALGMDKLSKAPGIRAQVYRLARALADEIEGAPKDPGKTAGTLMWFQPPRATPVSYQKSLEAIRSQPRAGDRELLELRFARELDTAEIAFVLELAEAEVSKRLDVAEAEARKLFQAGSDVDIPRALLEAFALQKLDDEISGSNEEEPPLLPLGTVLGERYQLESHLGSGAFADVYRASDVAVPGHQVALKLLKRKSISKRAQDQALRELRIIAAVFHPSIVQFKDHGWYEDRFWFVMPWYEGETLEARMERERLTRPEAKRIFVPLARALAAMHAAGVRHQDVKPDNIFLANLKGFGDQEVLPVLLDLGVAAKDAELVIAGTPTYFAPEVAAQFSYREGDPFPEHTAGPASDVFALALSMRNALEPTTQPIVAAGAVDSFIRQRARTMPDLPLDPDLSYLSGRFKKWMALDPTKRPSADELAEQFETALTEPEERRERRMRVLRVVIPIATVLLLVFGALAYQLEQDRRLHSDKAEAAEEERQAALEELDEASVTADQLREQVSAAEQRIESNNLSRQQLAEQLAQTEGRLNVTRNQLSRSRTREREKGKEIESLTEERDDLRAQAQALTRRITELSGQLETRTSELQTARRSLSEVRANLQSTEQSLRTAEQERDTARRERQALESRVAGLERERDTAQTAQRQAERAAQQAQNQLTRSQQQLATAQQQVRDLQAQVRQLQRENRQLRRGATPTLPSPMTPDVNPTPERPSVMVTTRR